MNQSPPPLFDPGKWIEDIKVGGQLRNDAWKAVYLHWHDHLIAPALEMGLSQTEADNALSQMPTRVNHLANVDRWQVSSGKLLLKDLCLSVADEVVVRLFQTKEADAGQRAVTYIRQHWRENLLVPFEKLADTAAEAVFLAGVERMRQRVLSPASLFELQEWHVLKHLQDETLLVAVEMGGRDVRALEMKPTDELDERWLLQCKVIGALASGHIQKTWLGKGGNLAQKVRKNRGTEEDAEDVCGKTMENFYRQAVSESGIPLKKTLETYLFQIGWNIWRIEAKHGQRVETGLSDDSPLLKDTDVVQAHNWGLHDPTENEVRDCVQKLNEPLRETYLLHLDELSNKEIAEKLGVSEQLVKNRKVIAKDLIEECLCVHTLKEPLKTIYRLHKSGKKDKDIASTQKLDEQAVAQIRAAAALLVGQCLERARNRKRHLTKPKV